MSKREYLETFDNGAGGWLGWVGGGGGPLRLENRNGALVSRSPWGVDINHAPPGAGYMHLLFCLMTTSAKLFSPDHFAHYGDRNRFVAEDHSRDFTGAKFHVRVRGDADLKSAKFMLHAQADVGPIRTNWALTGQPIQVTREWSEQTLTLDPDPSQWLCMGVRKVGADCAYYGEAPVADVLRDLNVNIILVIGMLDVVPAHPGLPPGADPHVLKAGKDYPIVWSRLPEGEILLDTVRIEYK